MSRLLSVMIPVTLAVASGDPGCGHASSAQEAHSSFCGRVVDVSCTSPSSAVTVLLTDLWGTRNWRVVIPAEHRHLFGSRIEERYDQRLVCVAPLPPASAKTERVVVRDPGQLVVKGAMPASVALPDDVARSCDPDLRLPILNRDVKPQYTAEAMRAKIHGSVVLRGIIDRNGAVRDVLILQSLEPSLDAAAREAFARWEFRPATRRGEPVPMAISVQMAFTMR